MTTRSKVQALLTAGEKRQAVVLLGLSTLAAVAQTVAILSVMPFVLLLSNPDALQSSLILARLNELAGTGSARELLVLLGIVGISTLAVGNAIIALEHWRIHRYLALLTHRLETAAMHSLLSRPLEFFSSHHGGKLSNVVLEQVERVTDGVIGSFFGVVSNLVLTLVIVAMLMVVDWLMTLITLLALVVLYLLVFLSLKRKIAKHGAALTRLGGELHTAVKEAFGGIREIKINRAEAFFARRFEAANRPIARLSIRSSVLEFLPHFLLETLVFAGLIGVALYLVAVADYGDNTLAYIALYGLATYRLVPALNAVFVGLSEIQHDSDAVNAVSEAIAAERPVDAPRNSDAAEAPIRLQKVTYRHPQAEEDQLHDVGLEIRPGSSVCLFGDSGAGKSTLLNILAGLTEPRRGRFLLGEKALENPDRRAWRGNVGFCPQHVYLFADTIANNIAFGVDGGKVDRQRVEAVGRLALLDKFVQEATAAGYDSPVGEGGHGLSGGQRQRIGIARALYKDASILILDESLAGLDAATRSAILDNIFGLRGKTLILSTHDTDVAKRCETVFFLDSGRLVASGRFEDVVSAGL